MNKYLLLFFYFLAVAILFYPVIFQNNTFGSGDTLNPYAINHILDIYKDKIGQWPLWQPWIFSGMPTVEAFTYINQLYIPTTILTWLGFSDNGIQFIHLIFSAMGMYLLMKQFKMNSLISFSISLLWMLNPFLITMIVFGHGSQMMTAAYIPWIIYAINNLYRNTSLRNALILALLIGLQLQRGHVQIAYYSWMLFGAYFLWALHQNFCTFSFEALFDKPKKSFDESYDWGQKSTLILSSLLILIYFIFPSKLTSIVSSIIIF